MNQTITTGEVVGAGPDKTVLVFKRGINCAMGKQFGGFSNLTVKAGAWGYVSNGSFIGKRFPLTVFDGQTEGGIQINGNTQNNVIQDVVFRNSKVGIACGTFGSAGGGYDGDPFLDRLAIANCTFENLTDFGINLRQDASHAPNGAIAVQNCVFRNVKGTGVRISQGQTYLVQTSSFDNVATTDGASAVDITSQGAVAVSHLTIANTTATSNTAIKLAGKGAASHCTIKGFATSLAWSSDAYTVDNFDADGDLSAGTSEVYIANSKFKGIDGIGKGLLQKGSAPTEVPTIDIQLDVTPPPAVALKSVTRRTSYNLLQWDKVDDPESGVMQYAIFDKKSGTEVGRTAMATHKLNPLEPGKFMPDTFADANATRSAYTTADYEVKAINGANLLSGGGRATIKRWSHLEGVWTTPEGTKIETMDMSAVTVSGTNVTITAKGKTYDKTQLGSSGVPDFYYLPIRNMRNYCADFAPGCTQQTTIGWGQQGADARQPSRPFAWIGTGSFTVSSGGPAQLSLYDASGKRVRVLYSGLVEPHKPAIYRLPTGRIAGGLYVLRLETENATASRKLMVHAR